MKKLMFAAAAIAAGVAMADVTSANVVGYNTTQDKQTSFIFGIPFANIGESEVTPFSALNCPEGLEDDDQIQVAYTDEDGFSQMRIYFYYGEWLDEGYNPVEEGDGVPFAKSAWFITSSEKSMTISGEVKSGEFIHTFTESSDLVSSAFPVDFCPNGENVSWGVSDDAQIQTAYVDEDGFSQMRLYFYYGEWLDEGYNTVDPETSIAKPGEGFWLLLNDSSETFSEVSPLAE